MVFPIRTNSLINKNVMPFNIINTKLSFRRYMYTVHNAELGTYVQIHPVASANIMCYVCYVYYTT